MENDLNETRRLELHELLLSLNPEAKAYFQEPENIHMQYPCFIYEVDQFDIKRANNQTYALTRRYQVTYVSTDVTNTQHEKVARLPMSSFSRYFVADQLHHYVYSLYF